VPVAYVSGEELESAEPRIDDLPVLHDLKKESRITDHVDTAIVIVPADKRQSISALVDALPMPNIVVIPDLSDVQSLWVTSRDLGGILGLEMKKGLLLRRNRILKRISDVVIATMITANARTTANLKARLSGFCAMSASWHQSRCRYGRL